MSDEPFTAHPRSYWQTTGDIRRPDGTRTSWTETVRGHTPGDPDAELVGLVVEETREEQKP